MLVKLDHDTPGIRVKINKKYVKTPPRYTSPKHQNIHLPRKKKNSRWIHSALDPLHEDIENAHFPHTFWWNKVGVRFGVMPMSRMLWYGYVHYKTTIERGGLTARE